MRAITRSLVVGAAVLGLAGAGVGAASASTWPKPRPHHHSHHHIQKQVNKQINKELVKVHTEDNDRIVSDSVIFVFGPQQSNVRGR
ncbi:MULTISPECIES: hypothetical protein [unclassified Streptomyces]|uniref:hypothetical protein n=1 Tax=unclassified Streptomyces TaxID=2593676 RepID=UPI002DDB840D|nr:MULTISPECIES: hypothetical protein [unclassified Streptomyces]WSA93394.1 hypothetical protein OIE63_18750 [Streptomyces sp. NBC_01795]WSB77763.1 hypothetical protein OHB04_19580 [Streptomyces sp. NBC_01775]WSS13989.1 hypothetical protein OG533_20465 [Streptomyces sp. NBC_01186]WSS42809.1 hypothetical protein OG220_21170 [Streptomyces sp. NBC_01187]